MIRQLTKNTREGVRYFRTQAVENQIRVALQSDFKSLRARLLVTDPALSEYLSSECLVYLVRDALRREDEDRLKATLPVLLGRCEAILSVKIGDSLPNADQLREEVLSEFSGLLASDGTGDQPDELDIYECRFNMAFRTLRIDVLKRELNWFNRAEALPDEQDQVGPYAYEDQVFACLSEAFRTPAKQETALIQNGLWEAINALPPEERMAVILCKVFEYKEESSDPKGITAATVCNCTGRTIRNRLSRAAAKLSEFKEDI